MKINFWVWEYAKRFRPLVTMTEFALFTFIGISIGLGIGLKLAILFMVEVK